MVKSFAEFLEENYNYTTSDFGDIEFEDRWFYYDSDDEIIYGSDEKPVNKTCLFYFNPKSCEIYLGGNRYKYDINNPCLIITCQIETDEIKLYKEDNVFEYLEHLGNQSLNFDIQSKDGKRRIQKMFDDVGDDYRILFIYGSRLIGTTFDIIEEN